MILSWKQQVLQEVRRSLKQNLIPGIVIWCMALSVLALYSTQSSVRLVLDHLGQLKYSYGYLYSAIATLLIGGWVPFLFLQWTGRIPKARFLKEWVFVSLLWAWKGMEVDLLYTSLGQLFGNSSQPGTIASKTICDMFIYNPLWACPSMMVLYVWKEKDFRLSAFREAFAADNFLKYLPPMMLTSWLIWIPAVSTIYAMPANLQIPLFNLVLCFSILVVNTLTQKSNVDAG